VSAAETAALAMLVGGSGLYWHAFVNPLTMADARHLPRLRGGLHAVARRRRHEHRRRRGWRPRRCSVTAMTGAVSV
jgi:hypothetical protein